MFEEKYKNIISELCGLVEHGKLGINDLLTSTKNSVLKELGSRKRANKLGVITDELRDSLLSEYGINSSFTKSEARNLIRELKYIKNHKTADGLDKNSIVFTLDLSNAQLTTETIIELIAVLVKVFNIKV